MPGKSHTPVSPAQVRWAFAAEARGELEPGTARRWARAYKRAKARGTVRAGGGACGPAWWRGETMSLGGGAGRWWQSHHSPEEEQGAPWWREPSHTVAMYEGHCGRPGQRGGSRPKAACGAGMSARASDGGGREMFGRQVHDAAVKQNPKALRRGDVVVTRGQSRLGLPSGHRAVVVGRTPIDYVTGTALVKAEKAPSFGRRAVQTLVTTNDPVRPLNTAWAWPKVYRVRRSRLQHTGQRIQPKKRWNLVSAGGKI
jgi:hypothetical protein